jgi:GNAT superfamily N-acetyltransferase
LGEVHGGLRNWYFEIIIHWYFKKAKSGITLTTYTSPETAMTIAYHEDRRISPEQFASVFDRSGIRRPTSDLPRMARMLEHGNLLLTAWDGERLVGVARGLTDFSFCCYLSDLAVDREYQKQGIGRELLRRVHAAIGPQTNFLLLAAPEAMAYYPKVGFAAVENGWIIRRSA